MNIKNHPIPIKIYNQGDFPNYLPQMSHLYDDLFSGGKGFRSLLVQKVALPLGLQAEPLKLLCQTVEFIHNASLLHDDLVDQSALRRGKTAAWLKYGSDYAVLAGDYLLARVMFHLSSFGNMDLVQFTSHTISELVEGEWMQDALLGDFDLDLESLTQVHSLKTASLFRWCIYAPFIIGGIKGAKVKELALEIGTSLGLLLQRSDDLLDYGVRNEEGKPTLGDLKSGYLNSFGTFLLQGQDFGKPFKDVKNLEDIYKVVGWDFFQTQVREFDKINQSLVELYQHSLKKLGKELKGSQSLMVKNLWDIAHILYWRRTPNQTML